PERVAAAEVVGVEHHVAGVGPRGRPRPPQEPAADAALVVDLLLADVGAQSRQLGGRLHPRSRRNVAVALGGGREVLGVDRRVVDGWMVVGEGAGGGHQPLAIHSWRCGRSSPMVVSSPWPGITIVSGGRVAKSRFSIELMIVGKSPPGNLVAPGPPGKSVSPLNTTGDPWRSKHIEPGVWPGVRIVFSRSRPTSMTESSSSTKSYDGSISASAAVIPTS